LISGISAHQRHQRSSESPTSQQFPTKPIGFSEISERLEIERPLKPLMGAEAADGR